MQKLIVTNYLIVQDKIKEFSELYVRPSHKIKLLAVSKTHPPEFIETLYKKCGQRDFGENYWQELEEKSKKLQHLKDIRWHFIGQLQSNKIKKIADIASVIHSVSRFDKLEALLKHTPEKAFFLEVNLGNESAKSGFELQAIPEIVAKIKTQFPHSQLQGLMAIPPSDINDQSIPSDQSHPLYKELNQLTKMLKLPELSLGMSGDLRLAIQNGSTWVRIGTALFGAR